jgi:hypothetical protein
MVAAATIFSVNLFLLEKEFRCVQHISNRYTTIQPAIKTQLTTRWNFNFNLAAIINMTQSNMWIPLWFHLLSLVLSEIANSLQRCAFVEISMTNCLANILGICYNFKEHYVIIISKHTYIIHPWKTRKVMNSISESRGGGRVTLDEELWKRA